MAKDPRTPPPGSAEPDEALDLLRALARARGSTPEREPPPGDEDEKLDSLRELAARLDLQLRGPPPDAPAPGPSAPRSPVPPDVDEAPARPAWHASMRQSLGHEWGALVAALPDAATLVPRFDRARIVFIGISVGVLLIAAIGGLVGLRKPHVASDQIVPPLAPAAPGAPSTAPAVPAAPAADLAAIKKEMSDCDNVATKEPDTIHFLVVPLLPAKGAENDWRSAALSEVGNSFLLLSAQDALDGLRDGKLVVRPGRYTFAVRDTAGGKSFAWTSATAVSRLSRPLAQDVKTLNLGFDFSAAQSGTTWSNEFKRDPGTCYWVIVLVRQ
jgi:hypothetical protein